MTLLALPKVQAILINKFNQSTVTDTVSMDVNWFSLHINPSVYHGKQNGVPAQWYAKA